MLKITLSNNEIITDEKCPWRNLPWFPIKSVEFFIRKTPIIYLEGFSDYLYSKDYSYNILNKQGQTIDGINLLAKHGLNIYQFSINFSKGQALQRKGIWGKDEFRSMVWNTTLQKFEWGKAQLTNHKDWHIGIIGNAIIKRN